MHQQAAKRPTGAEFPTGRRLPPLLDRKDVDAVIVATPTTSTSAWCWTPWPPAKTCIAKSRCRHNVADGLAMVEAVRAGKRIFQAAASASATSSTRRRARSTPRAGWARSTPSTATGPQLAFGGAWVYPIPPDASPQTIDWETFHSGCPAASLRPRALLPLALLQGLRRRPGRRSVRAPALGHSVRHRHQRDSQPRLSTGASTTSTTAAISRLARHALRLSGRQVNVHCNQNNDAGEPISFYGSSHHGHQRQLAHGHAAGHQPAF
jgi:hypothetical protein